MMRALASRGGRGTKAQVAIIAGVKRKTSTFRNSVSHLHARHLIAHEGGDMVLTAAGRALVDVESPQTPREALDLWLSKLDATPRKLLEVLAHSSGVLGKEALADKAHVDRTKSTFRNGFSKLHASGLIVKSGDGYEVVPELKQ